jgi:hypothetical protein
MSDIKATVNKVIIVNGKRLTEQEFETEKTRISTMPGTKLVEVSPGIYATRLFD